MLTVADERRTMTVEEFARLAGIGRTLAYAEARRGAIAGVPVIKIGDRLLIPRAAAERVLAGAGAASDAVAVSS